MSKRIRYVQQLEISDCGAACLAMALQYHGRLAELEEVRRATGSGRDGVDALGLVNAARLFGLQARGVSLDLDALGHLEPGSILHWEFNHFVVFEKLTRKGVVVVDPAMGRRHISMEQFNRSFTGVAILLEPKADLKAGVVTKRRSVMRYLGPLLKQSRLLGKVGVSSILIQLFALAVPILTGVLVDRVVPASDLSLLYALTAGLAVMVLFHFLASFLRAHLLLQLRTKMDLQITLGFVGHMSDLPYSFFLQRSAGDLMMRLNSNTTVREILTASTLSTLLDGSL
ncbi:MAG TPA: cysteine peptidase family C39 domain-containing protein, partial [Actinomycetota bacterium]|nr:cysteine peptidase family C39 domain-containing protein [Actinomycetota bacterium]